MMDMYFKIKVFTNFILPLIIIGVACIGAIYFLLKDKLKSKLMKKLGYIYDKGLGRTASREFQAHYIKGDIKIHQDKISSLGLCQIKPYIKSVENKEPTQVIK